MRRRMTQRGAASATSSSKSQNISLRFGGVKALTDVTFDVREHEIRAIIGPNGAGKSSMLNCINGVYQPQEGSISLRGKTFRHMNSRQVAEMGVARTFQNLALFKGMSVLDNIMTGRNLKMKTNLFQQAIRWGAAEREETAQRGVVERIIDFLEIQAYRKTPVGQLPYGLQKRVDLGRALAMEPQVLLLDEPMAGMNVEEKQDMSRFILDVNDEFGTTIVLIEHDMSVVMDISDRVVVLDYGRKIGDGTPDEVRNNPDVIKRLPRAPPTDRPQRTMAFFLETLFGGLMAGHAVFADRARLRADLQGLGGVQLRAGRDGAVRGAGDGALRAVDPAADRLESKLLVNVLAFVVAVAVMIALAWLIERLVLGQLVNQEGVTLLMATLGITYFLDGFGQTLFGSDIYKIDVGMPKEPVFMFENVVPGRHPDQQGRPVRGGDRGGAGRAALAVLPEDRDRPGAARRRRRPPGGAVDRHPAQPHLGHRLERRRLRRPRRRHHLGLQARRAVLALAGRAEGAAGGDPRRPDLGARARSSAG